MPKYFGHKGHNKQTWKFKKTHPQLRVFQKETQARIGFFRSDRTVSTKAEITNDNRDSGRDSDHGTIHQHATDSHSSGQDTSSQTDFRSSLSKSRDGSISTKSTECPPNRRTGDDGEELYKGSQIGTNTEGTKPCCHRRTSDDATCPANTSNCAQLRTSQAGNETRHQTTQIYLKTKETSTNSPWVKDGEEAEKIIYDFVQTIVQQTQRHMQKQIELCVQQTCSGLTLGTPVRAREHTEQFCKSNNNLLLVPSKCIDEDPFAISEDWNDDPSSHNTITPTTGENEHTDINLTSPKSYDQPIHSCGGARRKTGFPVGTTRPRAVIEGQPAGSEDFDIEDYVNPRLVRSTTLIATSPAFAAAVNLRRRPVNPNADDSQTIEVVRRRPWDHRPHGRNTRSQEALRRRAEKKVAKRYPSYKD